MKLVRAGTRRHVDDAARSASVIGREVARDDAKLLHRIKRYALSDRCGKVINVLTAVEQDVGARRALTVQREAGAASRPFRVGRRIAGESNEGVRIACEG